MILKEYLDKNYTKEQQKNLIRLNCHGENITSLEGIEQFVNLKHLNCSYNELTSLKGIEKLTNLENLHCYYNNLTSLKGIEKLNNLVNIYYSNNPLPLPYSDLRNLDKIKLEVRKEVRKDKIKNLLL